MSRLDKMRFALLGLAASAFFAYHVIIERSKVQAVRNRLGAWQSKSPATFNAWRAKRIAEEQE